MNLFKSILSDDPQPENMDNNRKSDAERRPNHQQPYTTLNSASSGGDGGLWSFGDLVKAVTTKSESVLETYRRDLKEFGSGLRKESDLFREVANRAVKDLPTSGASAIDGVLKSTVDIISQGKHVLLEPSDSESVRNSVVYSRFDYQLNAIQTDARTYCDDPEDFDDYDKWKLGFKLSDRGDEIEKLIRDNGSVEAIYTKVVPSQVDDATFWCRYFYRVYKLRQQEDMRSQFVRRSLTVDDAEEELSWDVDDGETHLPEFEKKQDSSAVEDDNSSDVAMNNVPKIDQSHGCSDKNSGGEPDHQKVELVLTTDENLDCNKNSGKDLQVVEDLEWDEIGDIDDEKYAPLGETAKKRELFKRVNMAEDDEDLSWDIEDDDEPVKTSSRN